MFYHILKARVYRKQMIDKDRGGIGDLLEWLTSCGPAIPTMVVYQWKVQQSSSCSLREAGCLGCSLVYARIPKKRALMPGKG